jgi:hypothetical protein
MPLFFFNKYKKEKYITLINYFIKIFNLNIKNKKAFLFYWLRYYKYVLKCIYVNVEFILKRLINILNNKYNVIFSLINLKKTNKKKNLFFYYFFSNSHEYKILDKYKTFLFYKNLNINKLFNFNFYNKNFYNLFIFNIKKKINKTFFLNIFKKSFILFNFIIKIKILVILKNFFYICIIQFLIFWFNYYIIYKNFNINLIDYKLILKFLYRNITFIKNLKWNNVLILKYYYFFFNNIVKK